MKTLFAVAMLAASPAQGATENTAPLQEATAANVPIRADAGQIAKLLSDEGYRAKIETEDDGTPFIKSGSSGRDFTVLFLGCDGGVKVGPCKSIEFYTGFTIGKRFPMERTNEWNAKNRYGRAYVDKDNDPVIEMDLHLDAGGMPRAQFVENLLIWTDVMANFDTFVFDDGDSAKKKK
ncbi:YbjN domain-containing protein [Sphingopyxis sp.]|uniref:YbjN domain-containing protein n=1 Tax=Sphingopyxis sp. TaxID=1908224 RepID=UPI003D0AF1FF